VFLYTSRQQGAANLKSLRTDEPASSDLAARPSETEGPYTGPFSVPQATKPPATTRGAVFLTRARSTAPGYAAENGVDPQHRSTYLTFVWIAATWHCLRHRYLRLTLPRDRHGEPATQRDPTARICVASNCLAHSLAATPPVDRSRSTGRWLDAEGGDRHVLSKTVPSTNEEAELVTMASNTADGKENPTRMLAKRHSASSAWRAKVAVAS
jgi:hypothetical protein